MTYTINNTTLTNLVTEEVSRVAAAAYSERGDLYDAVVIHSRDADSVSRMIKDAIDSIVKRTSDICTYIPATPALSLYAPDMDSTKETMVSDEVTRAIALRATGLWLSEKLPARSEEFITRSDLALQNAINYLKTRTKPTLS